MRVSTTPWRPRTQHRRQNDRVRSRIGITAAFVVTSVAVMSPAPDAHAAGPHVVINELHYHPKKDNPAKEFVELRNAGDAAADISDADMTDKCIGVVNVATGDYHALNANSVADTTYDKAIKSPGATVYALIVSAGSPTYAATSLRLKFFFSWE